MVSILTFKFRLLHLQNWMESKNRLFVIFATHLFIYIFTIASNLGEQDLYMTIFCHKTNIFQLHNLSRIVVHFLFFQVLDLYGSYLGLSQKNDLICDGPFMNPSPSSPSLCLHNFSHILCFFNSFGILIPLHKYLWHVFFSNLGY